MERYAATGVRPSRKRRWWTAVAVLLALGCLWTGYVQWLIHAAEFHEPPDRSDAAIVLGAALWNDRPSPGLKERLEQARTLYEQGRVRYIIVSGGLDNNGATVTEAEGMKRYLVERGVAEADVFEEREATSTYENLLFSKRILEQEGWGAPVIVTHQYHGARAMDIARFVGLADASPSLTDSRVMWMPYHKARETLAFTKWFADKWRLQFFEKE